MALISRESLTNKLDPWYKKIKKTAPDNLAEGFMQVDGLIRHEPSAFEGMTNGEVMQAVYADSEIEIDEAWKTVTVYLGADGDYCEDEVKFDLDWWNAPYKAESEEIC